MTNDLVAWLRARFDEDERFAYHYRDTRALVEVRVKRSIVDLHPHQRFVEPGDYEATPAFDDEPRYVGCSTCHSAPSFFDSWHIEYYPSWWCDTVRLLALPYATQPGHRDVWRPVYVTEGGS